MRTLIMIVSAISIIVSMYLVHSYYEFKRKNRELLLRNFRNNLDKDAIFENAYGIEFRVINHIGPDHIKAYRNGQLYTFELSEVYPVDHETCCS